jgi:hypothetical protein
MKTCMRFGAIGALALLIALSSAASAGHLSISSQTFRTVWREFGFAGPFGTTTCELTLEGSLHSRTIAKVNGSLAGYVTRATLGPCSAGTATILTATLPWHIRYQSFAGTLPNISSVSLGVINVSIAVREQFGIVCLGRSTVAQQVLWFFMMVGTTLAKVDVGGSIPSGPECIEERFSISSGGGRITVLNSSTSLSIRLI